MHSETAPPFNGEEAGLATKTTLYLQIHDILGHPRTLCGTYLTSCTKTISIHFEQVHACRLETVLYLITLVYIDSATFAALCLLLLVLGYRIRCSLMQSNRVKVNNMLVAT